METGFGLLFILTDGKCVISKSGILFIGNHEGVRTIYPENLHIWDKYNIKTTYKWNKYVANSEYKLTDTQPWDIGSFSITDYPVYKSATITISQTDGTIILSNPLSITDNGYAGYTVITNLTHDTEYDTYSCNTVANAVSGKEVMYRPTESMSNIKYYTTYVAHSKGDFITEVSSTSATTYPKDGRSERYWYIYTKSENSVGEYIETVYSTNPSLYPSSAEQDGYWYTKIK